VPGAGGGAAGGRAGGWAGRAGGGGGGPPPGPGPPRAGAPGGGRRKANRFGRLPVNRGISRHPYISFGDDPWGLLTGETENWG